MIYRLNLIALLGCSYYTADPYVWYVSSKEDDSHELEGSQRSLFLHMV